MSKRSIRGTARRQIDYGLACYTISKKVLLFPFISGMEFQREEPQNNASIFFCRGLCDHLHDMIFHQDGAQPQFAFILQYYFYLKLG